VLTSSKAPHRKQDHQKQISSEAETIEASKGCSKDPITPIIAED